MTNITQKYTAKLLSLNDIFEIFPFLKLVELRHFMYFSKSKCLLMINETTRQVFTLSLDSSKPFVMKYHLFGFNFNVNREVSKKFGLLAVHNQDLCVYMAYTLDENLVLKAVYHHTEDLDYRACLIRGDQLLIGRDIRRKIAGEEKSYFSGIKKYVIDLTVDVSFEAEEWQFDIKKEIESFKAVQLKYNRGVNHGKFN
jgi:hypothetical protein